MFLLVSVRHVGAHVDEFQHGVSIQSSINLGKTFRRISRIRIGQFTVMDGSEADGDLVLIQTFLLYCVNQVILMLTSIFLGQFQ